MGSEMCIRDRLYSMHYCSPIGGLITVGGRMTEYKMPEMVEIDEAIEQLNNAIAKLTEATKKVEDDK